MKRLITAFILITLLVAACAPTDSEAVLEEEENALAVAQAIDTALPAQVDEPPTATPSAVKTDTPQPTAEIPTESTIEEATAVEPPTVIPLPEAAEEPVALVVSGQTAEGAFFLGSPEAPVTVIDYSDFL